MACTAGGGATHSCGSSMVFGLALEDGADDHGDRVVVTVAATLNATGLQMQDLAALGPTK